MDPQSISQEFIREKVAISEAMFKKGQRLYEYGAFACAECNPEKGTFVYDVDGSYGDYVTRVQFLEDGDLNYTCDCPYPGKGCKHAVAVMLDVRDRLRGWTPAVPGQKEPKPEEAPEPPPAADFLTADEIRAQVLEDRKKRAHTEELILHPGDMFKGEHLVETPLGKQYEVVLHDPKAGRGHCSCPDYDTNQLGTCKHILFVSNRLQKRSDFEEQIAEERFPFVDIYWDGARETPALFSERPESEIGEIAETLRDAFDADGRFAGPDMAAFLPVLNRVKDSKRVRVQETVLRRLDDALIDRQLEELSESGVPPLESLRTQLYPYQAEGVKFGLFRKAALIGDEMGLGKTLQAIVLAVLKKQIFGFDRVLVVTVASLKEQWKREIERFTDETGVVVAGTAQQRRETYRNDPALFKITNYEAVLRDVTVLAEFKPDLVILDEAQRIKNFNTKTADAVKQVPRRHALVLTGTPLENKLEDVYSIVQFLDPYLLSPLWQFAADHFMLSRAKKGKIVGYRNLDQLHRKLKPLVIRRRKEEVLSELPDQMVNTYYLELTDTQRKIHAGYASMLMPLLNKKYLTPMDLRRIQELMLKMRMVCDSTYLVDRKTHISPKLKELEGILDELVVQGGRKAVIFSEWTTMTFLIGKYLSDTGIPFVELTGKVPVKKRQALIDEFSENPDCKVFLSTDAGGTGLNLQAADCVINFELPWNPARMNQRIGRVNRIGQTSRCVNVVNLVSKLSIEEKILAGIQLKTELFEGVFDGGPDMVEFSRERRNQMLNQLREMMGDLPVEDERPAGEAPAEEIPEDAPHFLNPEALKERGQQSLFGDEEAADDFRAASESEAEETERESEQIAARSAPGGGHGRSGAAILAEQPPEKVEAVLNSGMSFIGGLLEMATGQKIQSTGPDDRMIQIDRETGEVTMKFKLPGF